MESARVQLRYHGVAAFEIRCEAGQIVLVDPFLSHGLGPRRVEDFRDVDLVLVSHGAPDHMGDALSILQRTEAFLISGLDVATHMRRNGIPAARTQHVLWGDTVPFKGLRIKVLESKHGSFIDSAGTFLSTIPLGFLITTASGIRIYHPGDTAIFSDLKLFGQLYKPQIGLIPVGAVPGAYAHMDVEEAALATRWLGLRIAVPMHYWEGSDEPKRFAKAVRKLSPKTKVFLLQPGEALEMESGRQLKSRVVAA